MNGDEIERKEIPQREKIIEFSFEFLSLENYLTYFF